MCFRTGDSDAFTARSVSCDLRTVRPRTGRARRSWTNLDIRPARPPLDPLRRGRRLCVIGTCQDQRQAIPMTCSRHRLPRGTYRTTGRETDSKCPVVSEAFRTGSPSEFFAPSVRK
jgi:hypothetical protein